jgi:hypothetical protein
LIIKVERSGGFAGIPVSNEIDAKDLPSTLVTRLEKMIENTKSPSALPLSRTPRGAADYFTYKISVKDGANEKVIECNQYNLQDDLKSLVKYVEGYSRKKLK